MQSHVLIVHDWHTSCGTCGYGNCGPYGWGNDGPPHGILRPTSKVCVNPGCAVTFTETRNEGRLIGPPATRKDAA